MISNVYRFELKIINNYKLKNNLSSYSMALCVSDLVKWI